MDNIETPFQLFIKWIEEEKTYITTHNLDDIYADPLLAVISTCDETDMPSSCTVRVKINTLQQFLFHTSNLSYKFTKFGAMEFTKQYRYIGFGSWSPFIGAWGHKRHQTI